MSTGTLLNVDDLAQEIRRADGNHALGSGADIDGAFEAVRKQLCKLPRYSFKSYRDGVQRARDTTGNWIEFDLVHGLFDPVSVDAARAGAKMSPP